MNNNDNIKRVFIVGAGASHEYGISLGGNLLKECIIYAENNDEYKEIAKKVVKYLDNLLPGGRKYWEGKIFEEVLSILQKERIVKTEIAGISLQPNISDELIGFLCKFLWDKSNKINGVSYQRIEDIELLPEYPYKMLIDKLNNVNDVVITTNYDALLDKAIFLHSKKRNIRYNEFDPNSLNYTIENRSVLLLKPLGSITWIPKPNGDRITYDGKNYKLNEVLYKLSDNPEIWTLKNFPEYFTIGKYPVIIPPTIGADIPNSWGIFFVEIYKQILNRLNTADEIYIIGYSFPEYYELFRILIQKALQFNDKAKLYVVNKDDNNVCDVIKKNIANKTIKYYGAGFKKWLNEEWYNNINIYEDK